jgi:hypothetical protein
VVVVAPVVDVVVGTCVVVVVVVGNSLPVHFPAPRLHWPEQHCASELQVASLGRHVPP